MKITFVQTGGTIDKTYPQVVGSYGFVIKTAAVGRILRKIKPDFDYRIVSLLRKDSLDITDRDRAKIYYTCQKLKSDKVIVSHGTDTMIETARVLSPITGKKIILTGALLPERFIDSDAMFNVGVAIGAIERVPDGVYIAMSGRVYPWRQCQKSQKTARFSQKPV